MNIPENKPVPIDHRAIWRNLTEDLIFAAAYYDDPRTRAITWMLCLESRGIKHNPEDEERKCRLLCDAINATFKHQTQIEKAHAANDDKTFRLRNADLLPRMT